MAILKEFKEFAMKGNVVDMAVGIMIGAAFSKIVSSLVADVVMPPLGLLLGGMEFKDLAWTLQAAVPSVEATATDPAVAEQAEVVMRYGQFIQTVVDFMIVALTIFIVIRFMNKMGSFVRHKLVPVKEEPPATEPPKP